MINVRSYGARGDGLTDDTAALQGAFSAASTFAMPVFFPAGSYRITSTLTTTASSVTLIGSGAGGRMATAASAFSGGSEIVLDSASATAAIFTQGAAGQSIRITHMAFRHAQSVNGQRMLLFNAALAVSAFVDVAFKQASFHPIYFTDGAYFQNLDVTDVSFLNCAGTIGTQATNGQLYGTLLNLTNVHHDGDVLPRGNTTLMNLSGIRKVTANILLFEGALPGTGWTILKLSSSTPTGWNLDSGYDINGMWIEFAGTQPTYAIWGSQAKATFTQACGPGGITAPGSIYLTNGSVFRFHDLNLTGDNGGIADSFGFGDSASMAYIDEANVRQFLSSANQNTNGYVRQVVATHVRTSNANTVARNESGVSMRDSAVLFQYAGGYLNDTDLVTFPAATSTNHKRAPSIDGTYGHVLAIDSNGQATLPTLQFAVNVTAEMVGRPLTATGLVYVPANNATYYQWYSTGDVPLNTSLSVGFDGAAGWRNFILTFTPVSSGVVTFYANNNASGGPYTVLLKALRVSVGRDVDWQPEFSFDKAIQTRAAAIPSAGTWAAGDIVWHSAPASGQPVGWMCTAGGTPGTWLAMSSLP